MEAQRALVLVGGVGKWQILQFIFLGSVFGLFAAIPMMTIVFLDVNLTDAIPIWGDQPERCLTFVNFSSQTNQTMSCANSWDYEEGVHTIVNEWDLVCDKRHYTEVSRAILLTGALFGAMITAKLSDTYGRKTVILLCVISQGITSLVTAWSVNFYMFAVLRFLTGFFQQGVAHPVFVMSCEMFESRYRTRAGMFIQAFWGIGMMLLAGCAFLIRKWRHLMMAMSVPTILVVPFYFFFPESIPWLLARGKRDEAWKVREKIAKFNNIEIEDLKKLNKENSDVNLPEHETKSSKDKMVNDQDENQGHDKGDSSQYSLTDILHSRKLTMYTLIQMLLWMTNNLVFYGIALNAGKLSTNVYINFLSFGIAISSSMVFAAYVLQRFGRRLPIACGYIVTSICCLSIAFVPKIGTISALTTSLAMFGYFNISVAYCGSMLHGTELFPTTLRTQAVGLFQVGGFAGHLLSACSMYLAKVNPLIPQILFGVLAIIAGLLTLLLPETANRPLPETIEDVERIHKCRVKARDAKVLSSI